jgi:hypothetical protein
MLENLELVDWASVRHVGGEASDIPGILRALLSEDSEERQQAIETLHDLVCHQGTLYEAAVYVAPFLIELLQASSGPSSTRHQKSAPTFSCNSRLAGLHWRRSN